MIHSLLERFKELVFLAGEDALGFQHAVEGRRRRSRGSA